MLFSRLLPFSSSSLSASSLSFKIHVAQLSLIAAMPEINPDMVDDYSFKHLIDSFFDVIGLEYTCIPSLHPYICNFFLKIFMKTSFPVCLKSFGWPFIVDILRFILVHGGVDAMQAFLLRCHNQSTLNTLIEYFNNLSYLYVEHHINCEALETLVNILHQYIDKRFNTLNSQRIISKTLQLCKRIEYEEDFEEDEEGITEKSEFTSLKRIHMSYHPLLVCLLENPQLVLDRKYRKDPARIKLQAQLSMSPEQIEGWAKMFMRNPMSESILQEFRFERAINSRQNFK